MDTPLSPAPTPSVVPQYQPSVPRSRAWIAWLVVGVLVLAAVASGAYWMYLRPASPAPSPTPPATPSAVSGDVQWQAWQKYSGADFLPHYDPCKPGECEDDNLIGQFTKGPYTGGKLYTVLSTEGMGGGGRPYLMVLMPDGTKTLLERDGAQYYQSQGEKLPFKIDRDYAIPELQVPDVLTSPDGKLVLEHQAPSVFGAGSVWNDMVARTLPLVTVFTDPKWGPVYTDSVPTTPLPSPTGNSNIPVTGFYGFYLHMPSGMVEIYRLKIDFLGDSGTVMNLRFDPAARWYGGEYVMTDVGGCGASNIMAVVPPYQYNIATDFVEIARTKSNEPIYGFKDPNNQFLRNLYDTQYYVMEPQQKMAYDQFVQSVPVFFWKDPLGHLVRFRNKTFLPLAECGKPVIYLYPTTASRVSVKVSPVGGMTFSEPAYNAGWTVTAQPDGRLTDASGTTWPYLFWEGRGGLYEQPKKGWVVARADVEKLLDEKLAALGLVHHEIADFKEFWLPRMQDAPYYFVTFLGNQTMDALAPLSVQPAPDTIIRVLMDFSPLSAQTTVEPFTIRTPVRNGFTVVEWGGVLR